MSFNTTIFLSSSIKEEDLQQYMLVVKKRPIAVVPEVTQEEIDDLVCRVFAKAVEDERLRKEYNLCLMETEAADYDLSAWAQQHYR